LRKTIGANRIQLIRQFFGETVILAVLSFIAAIILVELFLPAFNNLSGKPLRVDYLNYRHLLGLFFIVSGSGIIAGSYPALYLSSFTPVSVLKNVMKFSVNSKSVGVRKVLVIVQFILSISLIICTLVVFNQLEYMRNRKLSFIKKNIVYIPVKDNVGSKYESFKNELLQNPDITGVTIKGSVPTFTVDHYKIFLEGQNTDRAFEVEFNAVDYNYFKFLDIEIAEGRDFSKEYGTDAGRVVIINEEAVKLLGVDSAVGKNIIIGPNTVNIIGVIKNTYFKSLHTRIKPQLFYILNDYSSSEMNLFGVVLIKINGNRIPESVSYIEKTWNTLNPDYPFEYHFLDQTYDNLYNNEKRISTIFNYFTLLAIFISCLGLFGLASYTAEQRTKEIGIRKVLGASVSNIIKLMSKEYIVLIIISVIIACPISYFLMNNWLKNFAYRIPVTLWTFLLAGISALIIAILTVSFQAVKAARANPAEVLRRE